VAWFWGHEHNLCIYNDHLGLDQGRCLGHGAVPVFIQDNPYAPMSEIDQPPTLVDKTRLSINNGTFTHGFAILKLEGSSASVEYFEGWASS
jgi:hypothetical protein